MDLRTTSRISSDVLAQFYAVVRITVAVAFFTITREPPTFLVQVEPPLSSVTTALSPCFFILLIPYYLRLATRRALRDAPRYVDEGVCTDVEEEDEQTQVDLSEIDISSDETVIHDVNWNGDDGSNVEKCESCDLVFRDEIAGEAGRDEGDPVEEGPSEGNDEGLLKRSDMTSSDGIIRKVSTIQGDVRNSERLEEVDRAFREEITRAVDLDEMAVGESAKPKHDIVPCDDTPDNTDQSIEGDNLREFPRPKTNTRLPSPTPDFPPSGTLSGKRLRAYRDPAPINDLYISRQTRRFESLHVALESRTRPPWSFR